MDTPRFGWRRSSLTRGYSCFLLLPGMLSYCDRYSEGMKRVLKTFGPVPEFSGATAEKVHQAMCVKVPDDAEHLAARRAWRDGCLMRLAQLKHQLPQ